MEINTGDIVQLKKKHPCGSDRWQVTRTGAISAWSASAANIK
jgi:hypothetical protein